MNEKMNHLRPPSHPHVWCSPMRQYSCVRIRFDPVFHRSGERGLQWGLQASRNSRLHPRPACRLRGTRVHAGVPEIMHSWMISFIDPDAPPFLKNMYSNPVIFHNRVSISGSIWCFARRATLSFDGTRTHSKAQHSSPFARKLPGVGQTAAFSRWAQA